MKPQLLECPNRLPFVHSDFSNKILANESFQCKNCNWW